MKKKTWTHRKFKNKQFTATWIKAGKNRHIQLVSTNLVGDMVYEEGNSFYMLKAAGWVAK